MRTYTHTLLENNFSKPGVCPQPAFDQLCHNYYMSNCKGPSCLLCIFDISIMVTSKLPAAVLCMCVYVCCMYASMHVCMYVSTFVFLHLQEQSIISKRSLYMRNESLYYTLIDR